MTPLLRSLLASLLAILGLSWGAACAFAMPSSAVVAYCYDGTHDAAGSRHVSTERGPPAALDCKTTYDAVDRWSYVASACPEPGTSSAAFTYDVPSTLGLGAHATATTPEQAQDDGGALSAFAPSDVAANTARLDRSIVSKTGETRAAHVALHEAENASKMAHGVFLGDSQALPMRRGQSSRLGGSHQSVRAG